MARLPVMRFLYCGVCTSANMTNIVITMDPHNIIFRPHAVTAGQYRGRIGTVGWERERAGCLISIVWI